MVTPRSQRLTISKLVPTSSANFAWDHPLRLRACLKRSFGTRSSTVMMEAPSSQHSLLRLSLSLRSRLDHGTDDTDLQNNENTLSCFLHGDHIIPQQRDK